MAPPPPRRRVEGCAVDPNKIVSDFLNMRRSCKKLSMVELRGVGGEGYLDLGGGGKPLGGGVFKNISVKIDHQ